MKGRANPLVGTAEPGVTELRFFCLFFSSSVFHTRTVSHKFPFFSCI